MGSRFVSLFWFGSCDLQFGVCLYLGASPYGFLIRFADSLLPCCEYHSI